MKFILSALLLTACGSEAPSTAPATKDAPAKPEPKPEAQPEATEAVASDGGEEAAPDAAEDAAPDAAEDAAAAVAEAEAVRTGEEVYAQVCQSCHMANGAGLTKVYPPLAGSDWPMMEASIPIRIVLHGLMGEIEVNGEKYNNVMAPWGAVLGDQEVANVLNYVRSSWGNSGADEITVEKVAEVRSKYDGHASWTAEALKSE